MERRTITHCMCNTSNDAGMRDRHTHTGWQNVSRAHLDAVRMKRRPPLLRLYHSLAAA